MLGSFYKWIFALITLAVLILLAILGVNTHFVKRSSQYLREGLELEGESFEDRKKAREDKERLDRDLKDAQIGALKGFQADNSHYNFQKPPNEEECMTVMDVDDENRFPHKLIYSNEITKYFQEIIKDLEDLVKIGKVNPELDERNDKFALHLKRRNMVMYGAPGTGKTELIVQLARIIKERYEMWKSEIAPNTDDPNFELLMELEDKPPCIIQIDGANLQSAGKGAPVGDKIDSYEKLIAIIEKAKEDYYGDKYSDKPYIVFIEEADQGVNVLNKEKGKLLEDWKNFLSTPRDSDGLKGKAQDPNSCIIIATNNYENIDPALFRRGRLGKKLNFNWDQSVLKKYLTLEFEVTLPEDEGWQWDTNSEPEELYKMCTKIGFDVAKQELAPHLPKIISSWRGLGETERKAKEAELGARKNQNNKEVCNWLLHYLFTFHQYNNKRMLYAFNDAKKIQRYDYGYHYRIEELQRALITNICDNLIAFKDEVGKRLGEIRAEMAANFQEMAQLRGDVAGAKAEIKQAEKDIVDIRNHLNNTVNEMNRNLQTQASNVSSMQSTISNGLSNLQSQISRLSSLSSSGGSSSKSSSIIDIVNNYIPRIQTCVDNSDLNGAKDKINEMIQRIKSV